jgi:hypothetical protein
MNIIVLYSVKYGIWKKSVSRCHYDGYNKWTTGENYVVLVMETEHKHTFTFHMNCCSHVHYKHNNTHAQTHRHIYAHASAYACVHAHTQTHNFPPTESLRPSANCSNNKRGNHYYIITSKPRQFHMLCLLWTLMMEISNNKINLKVNEMRYLHSFIQCNYKIRNCGCSYYILFNWEPLI